VLGRIREARVAVEASPSAQTDEDLAWAPLKLSLDLDRVVARIEDKQGDDPFFKPTQQSLDLLDSDFAGLLRRPESPHVHRSGPALTDEAQLCDELVGPPGDDGLTGRVSGGMVVEAALGTALRVAAIPHAHIHGVDGCLLYGAGERKAG
jgi:hypothetical protein